jgi:mono/diheme cytochrome c family protein
MKTARAVAVLTALMLTGAAASPSPVARAFQASEARAQGSAANGKRLFEKDGCYECHGYAGQGSRDGARIASIAMPRAAFARYVRRPSGAMPAFTSKVLSDADLDDIYAYLESLPAAKAAKDIPVLNQVREK